MKLETIRCCVAGLEDATIGLGALLDAMTLEDGDARPATPAVYDEFRHGWVARRTVPQEDSAITFPAIAVFTQSPLTTDGEVHTVLRDASLTVAYAYLTRDVDSADARVAAELTQRVLLRHLKLFNANGNVAMRTRNGVIVRECLELRLPPITENWEGAVCAAVTLADFSIRETEP